MISARLLPSLSIEIIGLLSIAPDAAVDGALAELMTEASAADDSSWSESLSEESSCAKPAKLNAIKIDKSLNTRELFI